MMTRVGSVLCFLLATALLTPVSQAALAAEAVEFFEAKIRPVLAQDCYECHRTGGKTKAGLALDHRRALLEGGDSGAVINPGDPAGSLLIKAIRHLDKDLKMPKAGAKLEDEIIANFEKWITMGAPDPRDNPTSDAEIAKDTDWAAVMERRKSWWSFQPVGRPEVPAGDHPHPVDRFIAAGIAVAGLKAGEQADRTTLIRRLSFGLRGLPPTPGEVLQFRRDTRSDAYERLVDGYLASPQFGERWARHWMDWLRYADSHGSEGDPMIPQSWQYRDYLIRALNADVPYDQLVREHVAGDLLTEPRVSEGRNESAIGPAHLRMVFHGFAPTDALDEQVRFTDDQINVLTKGFLGLTVSCARCHDHKFDAISQKDYYALYGIFASNKPGMVTVEAGGEEEKSRRQKMELLKKEVRTMVADHWLQSADAVVERLEKEKGLYEKADNPNHVLHAMQVASKNGGKLEQAIKGWGEKAVELKAHRERKYRYDWDLSMETGGGTTRGPSASRRAAAGAFTLAIEGESAIGTIFPSGVYSHLHSTKDPGVALTPRSKLDGKYQVWARVTGDGNPMIRYAVENYPRNGTVYPTGRIKGDWKWQRWGVDYWEGDHIHLEITTARDQAVLANNSDRSWFGVREVLIVKRGAPDPPGELLDFVEPLLAAAQGREADVKALYKEALSKAALAWKEGSASDGQAMLLQELLAKNVLSNKSIEIPGVAGLLEEYRTLEAAIKVPTRVPGVWEADSFDQPLFDRGNHKKPLAAVPRRFLEAIDGEPYRTTGSGRRELAEDMLREDNPFTSRVIANRIWHHLFGRGIVPSTDNFGRLGEKPTHPELLDYLATRFVDEGWSMKKAVRLLVTSETWKRSSEPSGNAKASDPGNKWLSHFRVQRLEAEAIRDSLLAVTGELQDQMYGAPITGGTPRRSVYMRVKRNDLDAFLLAFDAPVPVSTVGRRDVTTVPAQSLTMLNSDFVIGLAERWAGKVQEEATAPRVQHMFETALGRSPSADEAQSAQEFLKAMSERRQAAGADRAKLETEFKEVAIKLEELRTEAHKRVLAVKGVGQQGDRKATSVPPPIALWDFEGNGEDRLGKMHTKLHGGAKIENGALQVGHKNGYASTAALRQPLRAKTLEAWVQLDNLDQKGGGVISLQSKDGKVFDAIVFAESSPQHWMAGSDRHNRTMPFGGTAESSAQNGPVHVAITWAADGTVTAYREGRPYGKAYQKDAKGFAAGASQVLFGNRHGTTGGNRLLSGKIFEARLYDRALTASQVATSASKKTEFITKADLLAAMSAAERGEQSQLQERQKRLQAAMANTEKPGRPNNEWADYAHALFNLKEFIYVR